MKTCPESVNNTLDYIAQFSKKTMDLRIPLCGSLDITHRCNLRCVHCYTGPQKSAKSQREMNTERILSLIDEITEAGCLYLLISGGEPLLRDDFTEIYRHIKNNGILLTLFTNGTLITEDVIETFVELPPQEIEISLYGATEKTYETITRVKGSYRMCLKGIQILLNHNIKVNLKTVLMTMNQHELFEMEKMAKDLGVKFRFDAAIFPRFNGDKSPMALRVNPEEAVEKELSDNATIQKYRKHFEKYQNSSPLDTLYVCGAGITNFHIDPYGNLQPCLMTLDLQYNLNPGDFFSGWKDVIPAIMEKKEKSGYNCNICKMQSLCGFCPAFFKLESGSEHSHSEYLCRMGRHRYRMIQNITNGGLYEKAGYP